MAKTILIIDDVQDILSLLSRLFKSKGFNVITALSIAEARNFVPESDIVLSDIRLRDENGIEFLEEIRKQEIDKPFLMMSGLFSETEGEKALELTGYPVIQKPPHPDELLRIVNEVIAEHRL